MTNASARSGMRRTPRVILPLIMLLGVSLVVALVIAPRLGSDAQRQFAHATTGRPMVTTTVSTGTLASYIRAPVTLEAAFTLAVPAPILSSEVLPVVTLGATRGHPIREGEVLAAIADRPVIVVVGKVPSYRTIGAGFTGTDVRQLQAALVRLHYPVGQDGVFDTRTAQSVIRMYRDRGYAPVGESPTSVVLPRGELVFVPDLRARTLSSASLGEQVAPSDPVAVVESTTRRLVARIAAAEATPLRVGQAAQVDIAGHVLRATISNVGRGPSPAASSEGNAGQSESAIVTFQTAAALPPSGLVGQVRITTAHGPTNGLTLPATALYDDGAVTWVVVADGRRVDVQVTFRSEGMVQVASGDLHPGDKIRVDTSKPAP
ncbi:MAG TPA: peptidoglycan-binding protein [Mycobacteriales bacterium]|nr:peptidoglycan-binding protein [Mycobacteriales bacterium]